MDRLRQWIGSTHEETSIIHGIASFASRLAEKWLNDLERSPDFEKDLGTCLRLVDLSYMDNRSSGYPLIKNLVDMRGNLDGTSVRILENKLLDIAFDPQWRCLRPTSLVTKDGKWVFSTLSESNAQRFLSDNAVLDKLDFKTLLQLFGLTTNLDKNRIQKVYSKITEHWRRDKEAATQELIATEIWPYWRRAQDQELDPEEQRKAAWHWLICPMWQNEEAPDPCLEDWDRVVKDLKHSLSAEQMRSLDGREKPRWPVAFGFEEKQRKDLDQLREDPEMPYKSAESRDPAPAVSEFSPDHESPNLAPVEGGIRDPSSLYESIMGLAGLEQNSPEAYCLYDLVFNNSLKGIKAEHGQHLSSLAMALLKIENTPFLPREWPPEWASRFWKDMENTPSLFGIPDNLDCLPAFELWFSLLRRGLDRAAVKFIKAASQRVPELLKNQDWWRALFSSLNRCLTRGDDRFTVVKAQIIGYVNLQPAHDQRQAMIDALDGHNEKKLVKQ